MLCIVTCCKFPVVYRTIYMHTHESPAFLFEAFYSNRSEAPLVVIYDAVSSLFCLVAYLIRFSNIHHVVMFFDRRAKDMHIVCHVSRIFLSEVCLCRIDSTSATTRSARGGTSPQRMLLADQLLGTPVAPSS